MAGLVRSGTGFFKLRLFAYLMTDAWQYVSLAPLLGSNFFNLCHHRHHFRFPFMRSFVTVECDGKRERKRVKQQVEQKMQKIQKENLKVWFVLRDLRV